ncbi:MAG: arabinose isomerase, partial [Chitinophagaceae bacterium]|nr:arabinose isomerase [Chitinophagaceae bacterium]
IPFFQVTGILNDDEVSKEISEWVEAAKVLGIMEHNRLGIMGNYYGGMLDIYTDLTLQCITFGGHIEVIEVDELSGIRRSVTPGQVAQELKVFENEFEIGKDCMPQELERAARTSVALKMLAGKHALGSLAYYHKGTGNPDNEDTMSSVILGNSLLTAKNIPVAGEFEIKNVQAMKIMDSFNAGGSFTEYYAMDYNDDIVIMGHDGPGHIGIAEGKTKVRALEVYHGKVGNGLSVEMSVKCGPVTLLSVVESAERKLMLLVAEADSVKGPILEIGNTNSRYRFKIGARRFVEAWNSHGPAHHCAVGVGHIASKIQKFASLAGIPVIRVC